MKNVLVTGGCGFIGVNLIAELRKQSNKVRVLDNLTVGTRDSLREVSPFWEVKASEVGQHTNTQDMVELVVGDIRDRETVDQAMKNTNVVVHLAAQAGVIPSLEDPYKDCEINVIGTLNLLQSAINHNVKKFVFASSNAPLGEQVPPIDEKKVPSPLSPYGASKLAGEGYCSAYYRSFGLQTITLRFSNVYGPRSSHKGSVVALFFKRALEGNPLVVYGDGHQTRDFIYVDNLTDAIIRSIETDIGGETFQIATQRETTVNEIAFLIREIIRKGENRDIEIVYEQERRGEVRRNFSDISKAHRMLGYKPVTSLEDGLLSTYRYFKETMTPAYTSAGP